MQALGVDAEGEDRELVTADPGEPIRIADSTPDPRREHAERGIPGGMSMPIVDRLQVVQVEEHDSEGRRSRVLDRGSEALLESAPIEHVGQRIERGEAGHLKDFLSEARLKRMLGGDVGDDLRAPQALALTAFDHGSDDDHAPRESGFGDQVGFVVVLVATLGSPEEFVRTTTDQAFRRRLEEVRQVGIDDLDFAGGVQAPNSLPHFAKHEFVLAQAAEEDSLDGLPRFLEKEHRMRLIGLAPRGYPDAKQSVALEVRRGRDHGDVIEDIALQRADHFRPQFVESGVVENVEATRTTSVRAHDLAVPVDDQHRVEERLERGKPVQTASPSRWSIGSRHSVRF